MLNIDRDLGRFRDIVRGKISKDLRKHMSSSELIGRQGNETGTAEELAGILNTISYEVLSGIGSRVPREYLE